ncbi:zinc finger protein 436-like [Chrysoperla carnea]|uniref:zinc finger protein 436-like n=1 Tax=Chrysoperla carnea TaxID=189513 RepID=UPI001D064D7D|nr:zinc finger protein 436-like [Chrysoperla carnea]
MELKVGLQFASYEELTDFIHLYEEETKQKLWKRSSRTIKSTKNLKKKFNEKIQYYEIQYSCIHGGQRFISKSKGLKKISTLRVDCPFNIKLRASVDGQFLEIRSCNDQHENHSEYMKPEKGERSKEERHSSERIKTRTSKSEKKSKPQNNESMKVDEVISVEMLCRLCGNRSEHLISIYEGEGLEYQLQMKINRHLPFRVERTDTNLPSRCCYQCASTLLTWHDLAEISIEADRRLKTLFGAVKLENFEELEDITEEKFEESKKNENFYNVSTKNKQQDGSETIAFVSFSSFHNAQKSLLSNQNIVPTSTQPETCIKTEDNSDSDDDRGDVTASPLPPSEEENVPRKKLYSCDTCQETFKTLKHFKSHLAETLHKTQSLPKGRPTNEPRYYCEICDYGFPERDLMVEHRAKAHQTSNETVKNENHEQESKSLGVEIKTEESEHETTVPTTPSSEDKELCNICNSLFAIKHDLKRHIRIRHPEITPTFSCDVCSKEFPRKYQMQKHRKELHSDVPEKETLKRGRTQQNSDLLARCRIEYEGKPHYQCEHCPRVIHLPYHFLRHQTIHTGVRAFFCHLCGKTFRLSSGLSRHIKELHHGVKKYPCEICGRCFASKNTRDDHMNIHTGARPFVCDLCGKCFKQKASLHVHKTFHKNEKLHVCTAANCGKQFRRAHELKVHGWVHTGFKPHGCTMCESTFRLTRDLKRHLLKRHGSGKDGQTTNVTKPSVVKKPPKDETSSGQVGVVVTDEESGTSETNQIANEYFNSTKNYCDPEVKPSTFHLH